MKKLVSKIKARKQPKEPVGRITNDTLAEHRQKVLAGGRKFKYPIQYARHKLVINAAIIASAALLLLVAVGWYLLYPAQNTSEFMYRTAKVVPVPVAKVDGQSVRYSDYLMIYRSDLHYLTEKELVDVSLENGKERVNFLKKKAMDTALMNAYAEKLAKEHGITVSREEIDTDIKYTRQAEGEEFSEATLSGVIADYYAWTMDEYRDVVEKKLLRQKVAYKVDNTARTIGAQITKAAKEGTSFADIATKLNVDKKDTVVYTPAAWVPKNNQDGGLVDAAKKLEKGQTSDGIKTPGDGYYYVKLLDSNDSQVQYEYIFVPLTAFEAQLEKIKKENKIKYYIKLEEASDVALHSKKGE